jgi:hypothetical protein
VLASGQKAHPIVFKWCITTANQTAGAIKVFWYHQTVNIDTRLQTGQKWCADAVAALQVLVRQLYENYWILLERTGYRPKRFVVEDNVREIARRVRARTAVSCNPYPSDRHMLCRVQR